MCNEKNNNNHNHPPNISSRVILVNKNLFNRQDYRTQNISPTPKALQQNFKTFKSDYLNFEISLPSKFKVIDQPTRVLINSADGQIVINTNGTYYYNIDEYLASLDEEINPLILNEQNLESRDYQIKSRVYEEAAMGNRQVKIIYILVDSIIFRITTVEESLFNDLDQIAQSFQYTP